MAKIYIMPRQGQSVESCVITEWHKKEGDTVALGDVLFSYETDKSSFDEKSEMEGTLLRRLAEDGDDVPCLDPVAVIGDPGEDITQLLADISGGNADSAAPAAAESAAEPAKTEEKPAVAMESTRVEGDILRISPRARRLAAQTGADLSQAVPTGPMGRIIERDVNALLDRGALVTAEAVPSPAQAEPAAAPAVPAAEYEDVKLPNIRKVIAKSMHASLSEMAQLTLNSSFDATALMAFRANCKAKAEALGLNNITLNDMVLYAVSRTLGAHRDLNAHYLTAEDKIRYFTHVNLGIAVDTDRGLMVPTVPAADQLSLNELSAQAKTVIKEAQAGTINPDKLKGASFTVTNLGSLGVESFTPVINPPQTGILGVNCIVQRVREDGSVYPAMGLSLTFDHRALDGAPAARFLKDLCRNLENFDLLLAK